MVLEIAILQQKGGVYNVRPMNALHHFYDEQLIPLMQKLAPYGLLGPRVEVRQTPEHIVVTAEIPGIEHPEHLHLHVQEMSITISGKVERDDPAEEGFDLFHTERCYGEFSRTVPLPVAVTPDGVSARYRNGLLAIKLKKNADIQGSRVPVDFS